MAIARSYETPHGAKSAIPERLLGEFERTDTALMVAEDHATKHGVWTQVETDRGRVLARFGPRGEYEYVGF